MKLFLQKQINVNTVLITVVGVVLSFGLKRVDSALTSLTQVEQRVQDMDMRLISIERWREKVLEFDGLQKQLTSPKDKP